MPRQARTSRPEAPDSPRDRKLLAAAERLFLRKGYHATTMDEVASAAGVSKKTIYQAFVSKEALFRALVQARRAPFFAAVATDGPADEILIDALRVAVDFILSPKEVAMVRLIASEGASTPALAKAFHDKGSKQQQFALEQCLEALVRRGEIEIDDVHETALMLIGMALGVQHIVLMLGVSRSVSRSQIDRQVRESVRVFLDGVATKQARRR